MSCHSQDARLQQIIESGDMEQLAEIVLNGEGSRLLGLKSKEPEIQAFLNNVPSYMVGSFRSLPLSLSLFRSAFHLPTNCCTCFTRAGENPSRARCGT